MKARPKPLSMTRNVKSSLQQFREVELKGFCFSRSPRWPHIEFGGVYRRKP